MYVHAYEYVDVYVRAFRTWMRFRSNWAGAYT